MSQFWEQPVFRKLVAFFCAAAIIAVLCVAAFEWARRHNNPYARSVSQSATLTYLGAPFNAEVHCDCPDSLIEGRTKVLYFSIKITPGKVAPLAPSPADEVIEVTSTGAATIQPSLSGITYGATLARQQPVSQDLNLSVTPSPGTTLDGITFNFFSAEPSRPSTLLGFIRFPIASQPDAWTLLAPFVYCLIIFGAVFGLFLWTERHLRLAHEKAEHRLAMAREQVAANPGQARFAWDLARVKLEAYFDRNLIQVNLVFWFAVLVMAVGFAFVLAGIVFAWRQGGVGGPNGYVSVVAAGSGIITQFIGATFLVIYRSTMAQASGFMTVLERINNVGMAVQVLDALPEGTDLKNTARAQIATLLLNAKGSPPAP